MAESEEELKSLLMKVKAESKKVGLKLNIQKKKIMASGPITSWGRDGETVETVSDFILLGSKITADDDCSHEIKTLTYWKKSYDLSRQQIEKQTLLCPKCLSSQGYGFSMVMYGCESWTVKKAECRKLLNCGVGEDS